MNPFSFTEAKSVEDAVKNASLFNNSKFIAGGTNLLDLMKENVLSPEAIIGINNLELKGVSKNSKGVMIGALVTNNDLAYHPLIEQHYPLLSQAILAGASPQLRNMATTGGNPLQRTRCYYFYDVGTPCNKRQPGSGCSAIHGLNRIHAILGASDQCIAVHPSDMCVALAALEATVHVTGPMGTRDIPMIEFHRLPGDTPHLDHNLSPEEMITHISLPSQGFNHHFAYTKVRDRASYSFALVSAAVGMEIENGLIKLARLALGGVAHKPWRDPSLEQSLIGKSASEETFREFAEALLQPAKGFEHNHFKIALAKKVIIRTLKEAAQRKIS